MTRLSALAGWLRRPRTLVAGSVLGVLLALGGQCALVVFGQNLHAVLPGTVYRSAQLSGPQLRSVLQQYGIQTVFNLRGWANTEWYWDEWQTTSHFHVVQKDLPIQAWRLPSQAELLAIVSAMDRSRYPILIHCYSGADRTGLVSAMVMLLQTDATLAEARRQLALRFGHLALLAGQMDDFFDLYAQWLAQHHCEHSAACFREWLERDYCPGEYRCRWTTVATPTRICCGNHAAVQAQVRNTSVRPWRSDGSNYSVQVLHVLYSGGRLVDKRQQALAQTAIAPGQSAPVTILLPVLRAPGRYTLVVDLIHEGGPWFSSYGSKPMVLKFEVHEPPVSKKL